MPLQGYIKAGEHWSTYVKERWDAAIKAASDYPDARIIQEEADEKVTQIT